MIIAVATKGSMVAEHFGRCPEYTLYRICEGVISDQKAIQNPGHEPGFLPGYLAQKGVSVIIAGGMGPRAQNLFADENIETCVGITGLVAEAVQNYLDGNLRPGVSSCEHQNGGHSCG